MSTEERKYIRNFAIGLMITFMGSALVNYYTVIKTQAVHATEINTIKDDNRDMTGVMRDYHSLVLSIDKRLIRLEAKYESTSLTEDLKEIDHLRMPVKSIVFFNNLKLNNLDNTLINENKIN